MIARRELVKAVAVASATWGCGRIGVGQAPTRLRLWYSLGGKNRQVFHDIVARFHALQSAIRVEPVYQGDYFESLAKLRIAVAAKSAPGLSHVVAEVLPYLAQANALEPLEPYGLGDIPLVAALSQAGSFRGGGNRPLVAIPFNRSTPLMYCNGDILRRYGREPPRTWSDLIETAALLTLPGERWGYEVPLAWWFWVALVGQAGGAVFDDEGRATLGGEAGVRALRLWQDLVHRHRSMRPPPGRDYDAWNVVNQDFLAGRAAIVCTSTAYIRYFESNAPFPVVAAPLPALVRSSVPTGGTFFVVPKQAPTKEKEAAAAFLRFFCETDNATLLAKATGYLPITEPAVHAMRAEGFFEVHPNDAAAQRQLRDVAPWPWEPRLLHIERDIVDLRLEKAVLLDQDPDVTLAEARRQAQSRP